LPIWDRQPNWQEPQRLDAWPPIPVPSATNGTPERHRRNVDRPLLVALDDSCGAMARLID
jgi:hypothetical protein